MLEEFTGIPAGLACLTEVMRLLVEQEQKPRVIGVTCSLVSDGDAAPGQAGAEAYGTPGADARAPGANKEALQRFVGAIGRRTQDADRRFGLIRRRCDLVDQPLTSSRPGWARWPVTAVHPRGGSVEGAPSGCSAGAAKQKGPSGSRVAKRPGGPERRFLAEADGPDPRIGSCRSSQLRR